MQANHDFSVEFVWTKFGVEAGESISEIVARKEVERVINGGVFLWGIGNNVGPSIRVLAEGGYPEVVFSPISSPPRPIDLNPVEVVRWRRAETLDGQPFELPSGSVITSRGGPKKKVHYALVCYSATPLVLDHKNERVFSGSLRNLVSGRQVGSSQVTSVVRSLSNLNVGRPYPVSMRIRLVPPFFVKLSDPVPRPSHNKISVGYSIPDRLVENKQCSHTHKV